MVKSEIYSRRRRPRTSMAFPYEHMQPGSSPEHFGASNSPSDPMAYELEPGESPHSDAPVSAPYSTHSALDMMAQAAGMVSAAATAAAALGGDNRGRGSPADELSVVKSAVLETDVQDGKKTSTSDEEPQA